MNSSNLRLAKVTGLLVCLTALAGCAVGPDFKPPETDMPAAWADQASVASASEKTLATWWTIFDEPMLTSLVQRAIESNLDLKLAESRIRQARAAGGVAASGFGPSVDAGGSLRRGQTGSDNPISNQYQAGFDAEWEMDIFGGTRRAVEAANADLQSAVEDRRDVLVTLTAEVARNYIELRAFQQRIDIARRNLAVQQRSVELTQQRFEGGFVSSLDVVNANAQVATTMAQIPLLESSARQTIYSLSVLLGQDPAALMEEMLVGASIPGGPPDVPVGVPSDLLRRRPDIRAAEADIHAATARIGVATADLYPRITLSGSLGWQTSDTQDLFTPVSQFWSLGPSIAWPVFQSGRVRSSIEVQKTLEEQSVIAYRQTVLVALQEVENALIASTKEQERRTALVTAVAENQKAVGLARQLYSEGQTDFLNVLDAQRSLYSSEDMLVQSTRTVSTNLVALYKALGGGWAEEMTAAREE